ATIVLIVPAFAVMQIGTMTAVIIALFMVAIPAGIYIACLASTLPALFPTASRYGAMGLTFNLGVSLFGRTTPLFAQALTAVAGCLSDSLSLRGDGPDVQPWLVPVRRHHPTVRTGAHRCHGQLVHAGVLHRVLLRDRLHRRVLHQGTRPPSAPRVLPDGRDA